MQAITTIATPGETAALCRSVGVSRATLYRQRRPAPPPPPRPRAPSPRALGPTERQAVLDVLHSPRFVDQSPTEVHATLLEEQTYLCSPRTMYRVLAAAHEVRERRAQARHPAYAAPELVATGPNQVWSWDITKLKGPVPYLYYSLYVILDLFSRYVVGWMVARHENAHLAERLLAATCAKQGITPHQLTIHADRGAPMRSTLVALLFSDLGITASHSRPRVSNDNPFSEAQFRTVKYRPEFPACQRSFKISPPAVIENSPPLVDHNDETSAGGRCGQAVCGLSKSLWARLRVHNDGSVDGPPIAHVPAVVGLTTPDFSLSFSRYESPRMLIVVA